MPGPIPQPPIADDVNELGQVFSVANYFDAERVEGTTNDRAAIEAATAAALTSSYQGDRVIYFDPQYKYYFFWQTGGGSQFWTIDNQTNHKIIFWLYDVEVDGVLRPRLRGSRFLWLGGSVTEVPVIDDETVLSGGAGIMRPDAVDDVEIFDVQRMANYVGTSSIFMQDDCNNVLIKNCDFRVLDWKQEDWPVSGRNSVWLEGKNITVEDCFAGNSPEYDSQGKFDDGIVVKDRFELGSENILIQRIHLERGWSPLAVGTEIYNFAKGIEFYDSTFNEVRTIIGLRPSMGVGASQTNRSDAIVENVTCRNIHQVDGGGEKLNNSYAIDIRNQLNGTIRNVLIEDVSSKWRLHYENVNATSRNGAGVRIWSRDTSTIENVTIRNLRLEDHFPGVPWNEQTTVETTNGEMVRRWVWIADVGDAESNPTIDNILIEDCEFIGDVWGESAIFIDHGTNIQIVRPKVVLDNSSKPLLRTGVDVELIEPDFDGPNSQLVSYISTTSPNVILKAKREGSPVSVVKCGVGSQWIDENWRCYEKTEGIQESGWEMIESEEATSLSTETDGFGPSDWVELQAGLHSLVINSDDWSGEVAIVSSTTPTENEDIELVRLLDKPSRLSLFGGKYIRLVGGFDAAPCSLVCRATKASRGGLQRA